MGSLIVIAVAVTGLIGARGAARAAAVDPQPMLVVVDPTDPFGQYYTEILRAEGLNAFDVEDVHTLTADALAGRAMVLLAQTTPADAVVTTITDWVAAGGNLIAMRPDAHLADLLGLGTISAAAAERLPHDRHQLSARAPGITGDSMQFHGTADR